jgi:putative transposase
MIAPFVPSGQIKRDPSEAHVESVLAPEPRPGDIVMDHLSRMLGALRTWPLLAGKSGTGWTAGRGVQSDEASRFSDAQKAFILKQAEEGLPIGEVCRKAGISQATLYSWRKKYAGLLPTEMRRLKALEDENARLQANKTDARGLAQLVRSGWYDAVPTKSMATSRNAVTGSRGVFSFEAAQCDPLSYSRGAGSAGLGDEVGGPSGQLESAGRPRSEAGDDPVPDDARRARFRGASLCGMRRAPKRRRR